MRLQHTLHRLIPNRALQVQDKICAMIRTRFCDTRPSKAGILAFGVDSAFVQRFACSISYFVVPALPNSCLGWQSPPLAPCLTRLRMTILPVYISIRAVIHRRQSPKAKNRGRRSSQWIVSHDVV